MAVSRQGSFTRAARSLGLSQPALSRQVQKLEQELGVVLFLRDAGRVRLTEAGAQVEQWAQGILSSRQALVERLGQATQELAGELRIAASTTPGEFLVPDLVAGFAARHPAVRPEVLITDSGQVIEELRGDRWDVGFVGARLAARDLVYDEVADDEVVLAAPRAHRLAGLGEVAPSELAGEPFIDREEGSATLHTVRAALAARGLEFPGYRVVMVLSTSEGVLSAVERGSWAGLGLRTLPGEAAFGTCAGAAPQGGVPSQAAVPRPLEEASASGAGARVRRMGAGPGGEGPGAVRPWLAYPADSTPLCLM